MSDHTTENDRLLMLAGKAVHAALWHDDEGGCDNPYDCGASVQEEAAAAAVIALVRSQPRLGCVPGPIYESGSDDDLNLDGHLRADGNCAERTEHMAVTPGAVCPVCSPSIPPGMDRA